MKNIYIVGRPLDLYRTQTFVSTVMENRFHYNLALAYFTVTKENYSLLLFLKKIINNTINYFSSFIDIVRADFVYFPAMELQQSSFARRLFYISMFLRKKCICDFYISCYDTEILDRNIANKKSRKAKLLLNLDKQQQLKSCKCIYLTQTEAERYSTLCGLNVSRENVIVIPLTIRERTVGQLPFFNQKHRSFSVMWWGTYIPLHGLERIIKAIKLVSEEDKDIHFYILGNSDEKSRPYKKMIRDYCIEEQVTVSNDLSFYNGNLEPFLVENCDLAMGAFGESEKAKTVVLNKCIEAISMKIPVLTQYSCAFSEFYREHDKTIFYSNNEPKEIAKAILSIKKMDIANIQNHVDNSYCIYKKEFSEAATRQHYVQLLNSLL